MPARTTFPQAAAESPTLDQLGGAGPRSDGGERGAGNSSYQPVRSLLDLNRAMSLWRMAHEICLSPHRSGQPVP